MDTAENLGAYLQQLRGSRSLEKTAAALEITVESLRAYENGCRNPRDEVILRVAAFYGVPVIARNGRICLCSVQAVF